MKSDPRVIRSLVAKDFKLKYKQSVLGFFWGLITPLVFLLIFTTVFSHAFVSIRNYALFVLTGLIFWQFFSNATNQSIQSFIRNAGIIKTINIPIHHFPLAAVVNEVAALLLSFIPFTILMLFFGLDPSWHFILLLPAVFLFALTTYGLGMALGVLNIYLRDVSILWNTIAPALFYLSPIAYDDSIVPERYLPLIKSNPLYHFFGVFRDILYANTVPSLTSWGIITGIALVAYIAGRTVLHKLDKGIISNL
ncbi:MAG TPA: ABC transporter permease [Flavobacteriales bacterium]